MFYTKINGICFHNSWFHLIFFAIISVLSWCREKTLFPTKNRTGRTRRFAPTSGGAMV